MSDPDESRGDAALHWRIKDVFVDHVLDAVPDGRVELAGGATESVARRFTFPFDPHSSSWRPDSPGGTARFRGSVTLTGHAGALRLVVADPWLTFTDDAVIFSIRDPEAIEDDERMVVARCAFDRQVETGTHCLDIVLDYSALELFLLQYDAGDELSPIEFSLDAAGRC